MKIYKEEVSIAESIKSNTTLSCVAQVSAATEEDKQIMRRHASKEMAKAKIDDDDLFYHKSILVSTNWNKNDDIFIPEEVWAAKETPLHKPTNLNHESSKIVGHITNNWAISKDGDLLDPNTPIDELPANFDILTGAVIYKIYHNDEEYQESVANLIDEILEGKQYVSMECRLNGFDYALKDEDGALKLIERNESTAFLTKHLRAYGGAGAYENYSLGRVLRNISFIGKAYTTIPANPESVIFTDEHSFNFSNASFQKMQTIELDGVHNNSISNFHGDKAMSEEYKTQITNLEEKLAKAEADLKDVTDKLSKADVQKHLDQITALQTQLDEATASADEKAEAYSKLEESLKASALKVEELTKENETLTSNLEAIEKEKVFAGRVAVFVDGGFDKEDATTKAKLFDSLDDEQFKCMADELIEAKKMMKDDKKKKEEDYEDSKAEEAIEDTDLETSEASEATDTSDAPEDANDVVRAEISKYCSEYFTQTSNGDK